MAFKNRFFFCQRKRNGFWKGIETQTEIEGGREGAPKPGSRLWGEEPQRSGREFPEGGREGCAACGDDAAARARFHQNCPHPVESHGAPPMRGPVFSGVFPQKQGPLWKKTEERRSKALPHREKVGQGLALLRGRGERRGAVRGERGASRRGGAGARGAGQPRPGPGAAVTLGRSPSDRTGV